MVGIGACGRGGFYAATVRKVLALNSKKYRYLIFSGSIPAPCCVVVVGSTAKVRCGVIHYLPARRQKWWAVPNSELHINDLRKSRLYSEELEISLRLKDDKEIFKWFLASLLFGGRITETIAKNTYRAFARHRLLDPKAIVKAGWEFLVNPIMNEGGYVRYDGRKSTQILTDCEWLRKEYGGSLTKLHRLAKDSKDLESKLLDFYGVGEVTANIFLRELRPYWKKADPEPLPIVRRLATTFAVELDRYDRKTLLFCRIEAGLIRSRRRLRTTGGATLDSHDHLAG